MCLLCNRNVGDTYKGEEQGVYEVNHHSYHYKHPELRSIYPPVEARRKAVGPATDIVS